VPRPVAGGLGNPFEREAYAHDDAGVFDRSN